MRRRSPGRYWYSMYGLTVESDLRLPTQSIRPSGSMPPDVVFRRVPASKPQRAACNGTLIAELRCYAPCHQGEVYSRVYRGSNGSWVTNDGVANCYIAPAAETVDVYPVPGVPEQELGLLLAGEVSTLLLQQRRLICLHASAVLTDRGAVAFIGPQGRGKSTMAATFLRRGAALLTDDIMALRVYGDTVEAAPGLPMLKLWDESARRTLRIAEELPHVGPRIDKKLISVDGRYEFAGFPARLRRMYVLDRSHTSVVTIRELNGRETLEALVAYTSHNEFLLPLEAASLLPMYTQVARLVPVRALSFADGYDRQESVWMRVMSDLEAS